MDDQLALDAFMDETLCRHVCLRLRGHGITAELSCINPEGHDGPHRYVRVERLRFTEPVVVSEAML